MEHEKEYIYIYIYMYVCITESLWCTADIINQLCFNKIFKKTIHIMT